MNWQVQTSIFYHFSREEKNAILILFIFTVILLVLWYLKWSSLSDIVSVLVTFSELFEARNGSNSSCIQIFVQNVKAVNEENKLKKNTLLSGIKSILELPHFLLLSDSLLLKTLKYLLRSQARSQASQVHLFS